MKLLKFSSHRKPVAVTFLFALILITPLISSLPTPTIQDNSHLEITKYDGIEAQTYLPEINGRELCLYHKAGTNATTLEELRNAISSVPDWEVGVSYLVNDLVSYEGDIYKVLQSHTSQITWTPDVALALFTPYAFQQLGEVPQWVQPTGGHDAYNIGDRIWFQVGENKLIYESLINANVWSPIAYPAEWKEVGKISETEVYGNETITALDGLGNSLVVPRELDEGVSIYCVEVEDKIQIGSNTIIAEWLNSTLYVYPTDKLDIDPFIIEVYFDGVKQEYPNLAWVSEQPITEGIKFNANLTNFEPRSNVTFRQNKLEVSDCVVGFFGSECKNYYVDYSEFERLNNITDKIVIEGLMEQSVWEEFTDWFLGIFGREPDLSDRTYYDITYYGYITDLDPTITKTYTYSTQAILNNTQTNPNALYLEVNSTGQKYASFDGTGDYIDTNWKLPDLGATNTGNLTWSLWAKLIEVNDWQYIGGVIGTNGKNGMYWLVTNTNYVNFYMRDDESSGACYVANTTYYLNDSAWHNLVAIRGYGAGADAYRLYIDGVYQDNEWYQANCDGTMNMTSSGVDLWLGGLNSNNSLASSPFGGHLDEVIVMNKSITESTVTELYNNGRKTRYTGTDASNIIGYWDFNQENFKAENIISGEKATFNGDAKLIPEDDATNPYNNLIGYWSFDADTDSAHYDLSRNNNHLTSLTGIVLNQTGYLGKSLSFDGTRSIESYDYSAYTNTNHTISFWGKRGALGGSYYGTYNLGGRYGMFIYNNGNICVGNDASGFKCWTAVWTDTTSYHHIVAVITTGGSTTLYFDNVSQGTQTVSGTDVAWDSFRIGNMGVGGRYTGNIDEFMLFNTNLNVTQVSQIYNNQSQRFKGNGTAILSQVSLNETGNNLLNWTINKTSLVGSKVYGSVAEWDVSRGYNESMDGLVSYYHADGDFTDAMGLNNGTAVADANANGKGVYNKSFVFDGTGDYVAVGGAITGEMSAFAWIKPTSISGAKAIIGQAQSNGVSRSYLFELGRTANKLGIIWSDAVVCTSTSNLVANEWQLVGFTRNGTAGSWTGTLYINGVRDSSGNTATDPSSSGGVSIGRPGDYNGNYFNGSIDEVMIFNRSLSAEEIKELYFKGRANWKDYGDETEFSGNSAQVQINSSTTNLLPKLRLEGGTNLFYTPYVFNSQIFTTSQSPPPSIQFVSPTTESGSYESTTILSNVSYSGIGITEFKTYLYNSTDKVNETETNYTEFTSLPFDTYTLFACATNPTGTSCTENRTITLQADATPPKYSAITNPTDGGYSDNPYCFQIDWTDSHFSEAFVVVEGTYYEMANSGGNTYEECLDLPAGTFDYYYFGNDTYSNGNQTGSYELIISKATPSLSLTSTAGWTIVPDSSTTITSTSTPTGNQLFLDDSLVANPYTAFFSEGNYTFKVNLSETQNYSSGSLSKVLTVANASASTGTMCLQTGFGYNYLNNRKYISC